jgi:hypothetical protein
MAKLLTDIIIDAPREEVWRALTDFSSYGQWNPYIRAIHGDLAPGRPLTVTVAPPGGPGRTFSPTVTGVEENREFRWAWGMWKPELFLGEHIFTLESAGPGRTRFVHHEDFTGWLVPLHRAFRFGVTERGFRAMNQALKARLETANGVLGCA